MGCHTAKVGETSVRAVIEAHTARPFLFVISGTPEITLKSG